ncbi:hypothetical protein [Colwellia hornerae]|uniref:Uncharacterized protein n=1 Tax=Colwellia hornerae TaxID=89402 RepID=A0A5C6Q254_9GAMM|nr:hypothetical protein [Colwellia hornerae]TWX53513.1 hypothetical protein ESZ26_18750 [Colwellia hornerae]TWX62473.1 hypothetical protein ESZ27_18760 [Colwellia hornerae]
MHSYIDKEYKQQAIKAWYDLLEQILTPEELSLVELKFIDGHLRRFCPKNIEDKIARLSR